MVEAIPALTTDKAVELFGKFGVFTKAELESRAAKQIIPAVVKYTKELADTVLAVKEAGADASVQAEMLADISGLLTETKAALKKLEAVTEEAAGKEEGKVQSEFYHFSVVPAMEGLRTPVDELEMIVYKEVWPMPSYGDLLFEV